MGEDFSLGKDKTLREFILILLGVQVSSNPKSIKAKLLFETRIMLAIKGRHPHGSKVWLLIFCLVS